MRPYQLPCYRYICLHIFTGMALSLFNNQLNLLQAELTKKSKEALPLRIYHSQARNIFFKLEALSRIFKHIHDKELFKSLQAEFKLIEDVLGQMDYYDGFIKDFSKDKTIPGAFLNYFKQHFEHATDQLSIMLKDIPVHKPLYVTSVLKRLENATWMTDINKEKTAILNLIINAMDELQSDYKKGKLHFEDIEEGLHEFRRKLRWISIYVAATDGMFQLKKVKLVQPDLKPYLTDEIVNLPYNVLPPAKKGEEPVYIESQNFYALSWLIQELGKLKDEGLKYVVINEAIKAVKQLKNPDKLKQSLIKTIALTPAEITATAQNMADDFLFKHGVLARIKRDIFRSVK